MEPRSTLQPFRPFRWATCVLARSPAIRSGAYQRFTLNTIVAHVAMIRQV
jgi:hypothetical protein